MEKCFKTIASDWKYKLKYTLKIFSQKMDFSLERK